MTYIKSLRSVTQNELQAVGYKAQDLALLGEQQLQMPNSFVILSGAFDETMRLNNLKYKIEYVMSHAQLTIPSTLQNVYGSARKALLEAKLPSGFEVELREFYDSITKPLSVGELEASRPPVRIIMSLNRLDDPEANESIIQTIMSFDELLLGIREAWALSYHPTLFSARLREHFPENRLKVALLVQTMDEPVTSIHTYSSLPQDHRKVYLQVYYGYPDLRDRVTKDYYAISKTTLQVVARQVKQQPTQLQRSDKELNLVPIAASSGDKMTERNLVELARLVKKIERLLQQPVKAFFVSTQDTIELLWVNRLGFDIILDGAEPTETSKPEPVMPAEQPLTESLPATPEPDDFIAQPETGVNAKLLAASMRLVRQTVERKYSEKFGGISDLQDMVSKLNDAGAFSRALDGALLLRIEEAIKNESTIPDADYNKAIEEVAYLANHA